MNNAAARLFCVPYLGGSAMIFRSWPREIPETIEVNAVELPGHGRRIREKPVPRLEPLVAELAMSIEPALDRPFALFGHSFGALICFELARELRRCQLPTPNHLIVSSAKAPHQINNGTFIHSLPDQAVLDELRSLGGTPSVLLQNDELIHSIMPALRADFAALETYMYTSEPLFDFPIFALGGMMDKKVDRRSLQAWAQHTNTDFNIRMFPGGHFFIQEMQTQVLDIIAAVINHTLP
jgi:medium-chain acyl-[acyl-carrier-protein] hydrolase